MDAGIVLMVVVVTSLALLVLADVGVILLEWRLRVRDRRLEGPYARSTPQDVAVTLLRDVLDEGEYHTLAKRGYLDVASPTAARRIYRVPAYPGLVCMYEDGWVVEELCVQSVEPLPRADIVAMHKLMIQGDEAEYLARARHYPSSYARRRRLSS